MNRADYLDYLKTLIHPVLAAAANDRLKKVICAEQKEGAFRSAFTAFEAVARILTGIAPWLEAAVTDEEELVLQSQVRCMAQKALAHQFNPSSADYADFEKHCYTVSQLLVECAFIAQSILRAPHYLWEKLTPETKTHILSAFRLTRTIRPGLNNWLLFATEIEAVLKKYDGQYESFNVICSFNLIQSWYCGDGWYADGTSFHLDYYNSMIIHPMMLDLCRNFPELITPHQQDEVMKRASRHVTILERMIAPDGAFLPIGRSLAYRCGVFHLLAQAALEQWLPGDLPYGCVREALGAIIQRTLSVSSYRKDGFLKIGLCSGQPALGEAYISTGSLYFASCAFLPLGLTENHSFWVEQGYDWTQKRIWKGDDTEADHPLSFLH